ncbi:MAG TPA: hypothetical protein ENK88_06855 [Campylobacterales bacterium]|nr:hypothetical protein [Campylobacterales bacterium]
MQSKLISRTSLLAIMFSICATADVPSAPINAGAYGFTHNSARLSFKDTDNNETGFKIYQFAPVDAGVIATVEAKDGNDSYQYATLTGLSASTLYGVNIVAYNADGESSVLTKWFRTIAPPPTPAQPTNVGTYSPTNSTVRMSLLDNADNEQGFRVDDRNGTTLATIGASSPMASTGEYQYVTITGLSTCTLYTTNVVAFNANGDSEATEKSFMTTGCMAPEEIPLAPSAVGVYNITDTTARVSFMDNSNNEAVVDGFRIYNNDDNSTLASLGRDRYPNEYQYANISGLTPDTIYTLRVVSRNSAGEASAELRSFRTLP